MKLKVSEIFYSIQGEGVHAGKPAVFLRLANCNLHCFWCDTKYTWMHTKALRDHVLEDLKKVGAKKPGDVRVYDRNKEIKETRLGAALEEIAKYPTKHLIITGGEPLLQKDALAILVKKLKVKGWFIEVETNGTIAPGPLAGLVQFNVSPKLGNSGNEKNLREAPGVLGAFLKDKRAVLKFVVDRPQDLDEILDFVSRYGVPAKKVTLMPQATTTKKLRAKSAWLAGLAKKRGFGFSTRLQVALFDGKRGC